MTKFEKINVGERFFYEGRMYEKVSEPGVLANLGCATRVDVKGPNIGFQASKQVKPVV
jgi:hypothetical protein